MPIQLDTPLTEAERDQLDDFLGSRGKAMDAETLDGFFCALIVNNAQLRPMQWMPQVLGDDEMVWSDPGQMERMLSLLLRKWNEVARGFRLDWSVVGEAVMKDEMYLPDVVLDDPDAPHPLASRWARGFGRALGLLETPALRRLERDEEAVATLSLIAGLDLGQNDAGELFDHTQRKSLVAHALIGLQYIYRMSHASAQKQQPVRATALPGRNDPCPCGSGQKFKKCCGAPERLH